MSEGVMEPAMNQGASKGPGSQQGARQPVSGLGSSAMSHRASKPAMSGAMEPAMSQGANEGEPVNSQQRAREPAMSQGSRGASSDSGSPQGAREPAMSEGTMDLSNEPSPW